MKNKQLFKRCAAGALAGAMALSLAACGGSGSSAGNTSTGTTASGENAAIDTSKHEVIKMLVLGNKPTNGRLEAMLKDLNTVLTEKANAELELTYVEWTDWQTQYNVALLSGDTSLDIITTATDWLYGWENTQKGAFLPLSEEMLQTYAPKTYAQVTADNDWGICKYQDEIYFIPEDHYTQYTNQGMMYRGDWAKAAGLPDGKVSKFEDFTTYFKYIKDNMPGVVPRDAGKGMELLSGYLTSKTSAITLNGVNVGNYALYTGKSAEDPYTIGSAIMDSDELYAGADLMKQWNDMGVWREDVMNYDATGIRNVLYEGKTGIDLHHSQTYSTQVRPNMDVKQPGSDMQFYYYGMDSKNVNKPLKAHGAAAISANSQHPERALMVYDLLRNDKECYDLINYGIEGTDYVLTEDGKLDYPEGYDQATDALGANFWCGRNDDLELENVAWWDGWKGMIEDYNSIATDYPYEAVIIDKTTIEPQLAAMANVMSTDWPLICAGKVDDPHAAVDAMRQKLRDAGYDEVLASIQKDMDAYKATLAQ